MMTWHLIEKFIWRDTCFSVAILFYMARYFFGRGNIL